MRYTVYDNKTDFPVVFYNLREKGRVQIMPINSKKLEEDMFDTMWAFLQMGKQKANYPMLKELCMELRQMMMQKTAGQRKGKKDISFDNFERVKNGIVVEAMCLVLSGELEYLDKEDDEEE